MPAVDLCQHDLPSGKRCRQIALKGESLCRHHRRNLYHHYEVAMIREDLLANLTAQLESESFIGMLGILRQKLSTVHRVVHYYPEANLALETVIRHIQKINAAFAELAACNSPEQVEQFSQASERLIALIT